MPSTQTYGQCLPCKGRFCQSSMWTQALLFSSLMVAGETLLPHNASVMSSIRHTETPVRYISMRASSTLLSRRLDVQLYNFLGHSFLSPFRMVCGNFILTEPACYVFFYAIFNLRNLLYIIFARAPCPCFRRCYDYSPLPAKHVYFWANTSLRRSHRRQMVVIQSLLCIFFRLTGALKSCSMDTSR